MKFEVGEIAILSSLTTADWVPFNGTEVTIVGVRYMDYLVSSPELQRLDPRARRWKCEPRYLRKRRPPPDWNAIAGVKDKPLEVEPA